MPSILQTEKRILDLKKELMHPKVDLSVRIMNGEPDPLSTPFNNSFTARKPIYLKGISKSIKQS